MTESTRELVAAIKELALASIQYEIERKKAEQEGRTIDDEKLYLSTHSGVWERYIRAGGSRTMINSQLEPEDDFGGQVKTLRKEHCGKPMQESILRDTHLTGLSLYGCQVCGFEILEAASE